MIDAALRSKRAARCALLAGTIWLACLTVARAQGACDSQAVKDYIADFGGSRTPPPAAWQACSESLRLDPRGDHKAQVLRSFAALRSRTGLAGDPIDAEKKLFQGSERIAITRDFLDPWRQNLGIQRQEQRFESTFYRAFLGSLGWMVIDRSGRLQASCVAPVERLHNALRAGPNWSAAESALLAFRDIPLWSGPSQEGLTLSGLGHQASDLPAAELRIACQAIQSLATGSSYWASVSERLKPQKTPEVIFVVRVPSDCALRVCREARDWQKTPTPESWGRVRQGYSADLAAARQRLDAVRSALPGGTDWSVVEKRLTGLSGHVDSISGAKDSNGRDMVPQVEKGLVALDRLNKLTDDLDDLVAYRKALGSLLGGDAARAKAVVTERSHWTRAPCLVAAYVAASYWETGDPGKSAACRERGLDCRDPKVAAELVKIAGLLKLADGALKP